MNTTDDKSRMVEELRKLRMRYEEACQAVSQADDDGVADSVFHGLENARDKARADLERELVFKAGVLLSLADAGARVQAEPVIVHANDLGPTVLAVPGFYIRLIYSNDRPPQVAMRVERAGSVALASLPRAAPPEKGGMPTCPTCHGLHLPDDPDACAGQYPPENAAKAEPQRGGVEG
jgi:hypothetical protein